MLTALCAVLSTMLWATLAMAQDQSLRSGGLGGGRGGGGGGGRPSAQCPASGFFCAATIFENARSVSPRFGGGGGGFPSADYFVCPSYNAQPILLTTCPQGACERDFCIGGGPVRVPRYLPAGDGLYCGKSLDDRAFGAAANDVELEEDSNVGTEVLRGGGGGGGGGGGFRDEFQRNNLYYFSGNMGVNLGPCLGRCVNAGPGYSDYCA